MTVKSALRSIKSRLQRISPFSRYGRDWMGSRLFLLVTALPFALLGIMIIALVLRTWPILEAKPLSEMLLGRVWRPTQGEFGFYPFLIGTLWVTMVAMLLAVPPCLLSAIYLAEYASSTLRAIMKPLLDLLAGIPSVIYGVWGLVAIVPWVQAGVAPAAQQWLSFIPIFAVNKPTGYNILSGGIVLAVMVAPVLIAVTYEVMQAVPDGLRESSLAVGATRWQTIKFVVIPRSAAGILVGIVLGFSRAFGETMAVLLVVGNVPQVPTSIFDSAYPLTALIANNYGEQMSIPLYDAALMGAALVLLIVVLLFNLVSSILLHQIVAKAQT